MAMIKCPECNTEVSETAIKCPNCGFQINKPTRSLFGKIIKWSFIIFNILMLFWAIAGGGTVSDGVANAGSDAEAAGAAIGGAIGMGMVFGLWVFGDIILGMFVLFTRPKS